MRASGFNLEKVQNILRTNFDVVTRWFYENYMTMSLKCHFMYLGYRKNEAFIPKNLVMMSSKQPKILGVSVDNKLNCLTL